MKSREKELQDALNLVGDRKRLVAWLQAIQAKENESPEIKKQRRVIKDYITKNYVQILRECNDVNSQDVINEIQHIYDTQMYGNPAVEKILIGSPDILNKLTKDKNLYDMKPAFKIWLLGNITANDEDRIRILDALTENVDIQDYLIQQLVDRQTQIGSSFLINRYASHNYLMNLFLKSVDMLAADSEKIRQTSAQDDEYKRNIKGKLDKENHILVETYPLTLECIEELLTQDKLKNNEGFHAWVEEKIMPEDKRGQGLLNQYIKDEIISAKKLCEDLGVKPKSMDQFKPKYESSLYELNLKKYPVKEKRLPIKDNETLTIGDLHGNQGKLNYLLMLHDVIDLLESEYNELIAIFDKKVSVLKKTDIDRFNEIISHMRVIKNTENCSIKLIGDMIADRNGNDYFTFIILNELDKNNIKPDIIFSNHDSEFIMNMKNLSLENRFKTQLEGGDAESADNLKVLIDKRLVEFSLIQDIFERVYLANLKAIDYQLSADNTTLSINTHAAADLDMIKGICALPEFGIEYKDATVEELAETIYKINEKAKKIFKENPEFLDLPTEFKVDDKQFREKYPFHALAWNRNYAGLNRPSIHNGYNLNFSHGHDLPRDIQPKHVTPLDNDFGKHNDDAHNRCDIIDAGIRLNDINGKVITCEESVQRSLSPEMQVEVRMKKVEPELVKPKLVKSDKPDAVVSKWGMGKRKDTNILKYALPKNEEINFPEYEELMKQPSVKMAAKRDAKKVEVKVSEWKSDDTIFLEKMIKRMLVNDKSVKIIPDIAVVQVDVKGDGNLEEQMHINKIWVEYKGEKHDLMELTAKGDVSQIDITEDELDAYTNNLFKNKKPVWFLPSALKGGNSFTFNKICQFHLDPDESISKEEMRSNIKYKDSYILRNKNLYYVDSNNMVTTLKRDVSDQFLTELKKLETESTENLITIKLEESIDDTANRKIAKLVGLTGHDDLLDEMSNLFEQRYKKTMLEFDNTHSGSRLHTAHFAELCALNLYTFEAFCTVSNSLLRGDASSIDLNHHMLARNLLNNARNDNDPDAEKPDKNAYETDNAAFFKELLLGGVIAQSAVKKYAHEIDYTHRYEKDSDYARLKKENTIFAEKTVISTSPGESTFIEDNIKKDQKHMLVLFVKPRGIFLTPLSSLFNSSKNENEFAVTGDSQYEEGRTINGIKTLIRHPAGEIKKNVWSKETKKEWKSVVEILSTGFFQKNRSAYEDYNNYLKVTLRNVAIAEKSLYPKLHELKDAEERVVNIQSILLQHKKDLEELKKSLSVPYTEQHKVDTSKEKQENIQQGIEQINVSLQLATDILVKLDPIIRGEVAEQVAYTVYGAHDVDAEVAYAGNEYSVAVAKKDELLNDTIAPVSEMIVGDAKILSSSRDNTIVTLPVNVVTADNKVLNTVTIRTHNQETSVAKSELFMKQNDIAAFNSEKRIKGGFPNYLTSIPGNASMEWAARNINGLCAVKKPDHIIKIAHRNLPPSCIEGLILYCKYKGVEYDVAAPYNADTFISEQQLKLFKKEWKKIHPEDKSKKQLAKAKDAAERANAILLPPHNTHQK